MQGQYNMRSPAVKRLMKEAQELSEPTENFHAQPLEDNLFEWHFTLRGPEDSEFEGGIYHGRIILPPEYPMKPPSIILLTPNGRFEIFKKICLSISGHHPESWQPSWSIRTALLALIGFMPTHGGGAIGSLDYTPEERKVLAKKSQDWKCPDCGVVSNKLKPVTQASEKVSQEAKILAAQINFQGEKKGSTEAKSDGQSGAAASDSATPTSTSATTSTPATPAMPAAAPTGPFPFPWAMPPGWTPPATGASGAAAFPRFPYPPPFMVPPPGMGGQLRGSQISPQQMPFFPPPMPFFPPMYQGLPPFPAQPASVGGTAPSANTTVTASASSQPRVTPSATASGGAAVSSAAVASAIKTPAPATAPQVRATDTTSSATPSSTETDSSYTVSDTDSSAAAASTKAATLSVTTTSTPTSSAPTTATPSGLRQRQTGAAPSPPQQSATTTTTTTTDTREAESQRVSLVMMVVLAFAIGLLLARRMYIQFFSPHFRGVMN